MRIFERWYLGLCWNLKLVIDLWNLEGYWFLLEDFFEDYIFKWWNIWIFIILLLPWNIFKMARWKWDTPPCFQLFWFHLMTFFFSFAKQLSSETRYFIAVVFDLQQRSHQLWVGGTKAERNHSKALVNLLCQSISHDSCVIQKTTQTLLENCLSFLTKSANTLTLHYQDKHIGDLSMKEGSLFVMFKIFQTVQCLLLHFCWYH
jgi:hypothetical protein